LNPLNFRKLAEVIDQAQDLDDCKVIRTEMEESVLPRFKKNHCGTLVRPSEARLLLLFKVTNFYFKVFYQ
jgi:hypothetical protein